MNRTSPAASGIVYAVLTVVGILMLALTQIDEKTDQEILSHYADSANRVQELVGFALVAVGALFYLWFLSTLRARLSSVESEPGTQSTLVFGAGATAAHLLIGGAAALSATSMTEELSSSFVVEPNLARTMVGIGYLFMIGSVLANVVVILATSAMALRTDVLPRWLGWVGFGAVVLAIIEMFLLPVFIVPLWVILVSVVMMRQTSITHPEVREPALV